MPPSPAYRIRNTFVEVSVPEEDTDIAPSRRVRSDVASLFEGPSQPAETCKQPPAQLPSNGAPDECFPYWPASEFAWMPYCGEQNFNQPQVGFGPVPGGFVAVPWHVTGPAVAVHGTTVEGNGNEQDVPSTPSPLMHCAPPPFVVQPFGLDCTMDSWVCSGMDPTDMDHMGWLPPAFNDGSMPHGQMALAGNPPFEDGGMMHGQMTPPGNPGAHLAPAPCSPGYEHGTAAGKALAPNPENPDFCGEAPGQEPKGPGGRTGGEEPKSPEQERLANGRHDKGRGREQQKVRNLGNPEAQATPVEYTTVMLRNIPNKYTRERLIEQLNKDHKGAYDFMYLPIDFKNRCNVGYAFINFRTAEACQCFVQRFHGVEVGKCLPGLNSKKVVEVTPARVQGLAENVRRLANSPVMTQLAEHPEWMPLVFDSNGDEAVFPCPDRPLGPVRPRGRDRGLRGSVRAA